MTHLWHNIGPGTRKQVNIIIEINKGSKNKYEMDKETGLIALDRAIHTTEGYPFDYGFIPQTLWDDGDPLDVAVFSTYTLFPGVLVKVRPVGIINMIDSGESDAKMIAVPIKDPGFNHIQDLTDINEHTLQEMEHFFLTYKKREIKEVTIDSVENKEKAEMAFLKSLKLYKDKFNK